jgi:LacI family transcriptional regulator
LSETGDRNNDDGAPRTPEKSGRRKGGAVTIHEVARHASVSPMTVSRVINGESNVREATRELVMEAVRALNYRPNPAARLLAGARDTRIALIYSNPSASYLSEMLVGALDGSHRTAAQLVLDRWDNLKPAQEKTAAQKLAEGIAGVILPPPLCESKAIAAAFAAEGVPAVALATGKAREDVSCVRIDDFHAAREMTQHLIAQGIRASPSSRANPPRPPAASARRDSKQPWKKPATRSIRRWSSRDSSPTSRASRPPRSCWPASASRPPSCEQRRHGGRRHFRCAPARLRRAA